MNASEPNHNQRGAPSSVTGSLAPVFGDSSRDPSRITSDIPTKYPSPVQIIEPSSVSSETPTKDPYLQPIVLQSAKQSNMLMEYPIVYPTGALSTI